MNRIRHTFATLFLLFLLALPPMIRHFQAPPVAAAEGTGTALARYGFALHEVAKASGIDFTHQSPTLDSKLNHIMPQVASMGAAVSVADFNRDGWADLYVCNGGEG